MSEHELAEWADDFSAFCARLAGSFGRKDVRYKTFVAYLRGLLSSVGRKNAWQLAGKVGMALPDAFQRLMYRTPWDADGTRDQLRQFVVETLADPKGIGILDETGMDEVEVRHWHSWHRHITLSMLAHAWLMSIRQKESRGGSGDTGELSVPDVRRLLEIALSCPPPSRALRLRWSTWRRHRRWLARPSHRKARANLRS